MERVQQRLIETDLKKKMVFIVGPRQTGKTWLAKQIAAKYENSVYLNYDRREDREIIADEAWLDSTDLLILDELHKMPDWKNYIKGVFDTKPEHLHILVTGSARLDVLRKSGDSLSGRFFAHRLLPFSPAELRGHELATDLNRFIDRGGFPEPFLSEEPVDAARWRMQYIDSLIRVDVLDFERIHDLRAMETVLDLLRERVGSPVSHASIARDVGVAPNTVKKYVQILEALFIVFRVAPFSRNIARSLLKEPKLYFFDNGLVRGNDGAKFENLVAVSLLKHVLGRADSEGKRVELRYVRNRDGREVDFLIAEENRPLCLIEVKVSKEEPSSTIVSLREKLNVEAVQVVRQLKRERKNNGVAIRDGQQFLSSL